MSCTGGWQNSTFGGRTVSQLRPPAAVTVWYLQQSQPGTLPPTHRAKDHLLRPGIEVLCKDPTPVLIKGLFHMKRGGGRGLQNVRSAADQRTSSRVPVGLEGSTVGVHVKEAGVGLDLVESGGRQS
eukprot:755938-Hanusia_phi.AAC.6